ncbi:MAG: phospholipase D-like domain-containing protein [Candidatus Limivicinus sp.]|jgi:putative cardiolipin synthase
MKKILLKVVLPLLLLLILSGLLSCILIPLYHKEVKSAPAESLPDEHGANDGPPERVIHIETNEDALLWRLRAIEAAEKEISLSTYRFSDDRSGHDIASALQHAAERGVKVNILVDGISGFLNVRGSRMFKALANTENVSIKIYNPINLFTLWKLNYRMHDKYLIADSRMYILGGRNTDDLFLGNYQEKQNIDRDMLVYSPEEQPGNSMQELKAYAAKVWALPCCKALKTGHGNSETEAQSLREHYEAMKEIYPEAFAPVDWEKETMAVNSVKLLSNPVETKNKEPLLWSSLVEQMKKAERCTIQTPYVICSKSMYEDLSSVSAGGSTVEIATNSVESGANPFGCADLLNQKGNILKTGAGIYENMGEHSSHAKTLLLDNDISIVGSFNCDMRSAYLDTELMLLIDSPQLNSELRGVLDENMSLYRSQLPDGSTDICAECEDTELTGGRKIIFSLLRFISPPIRQLF